METVIIGEITGVYGVKGWLKLKSWAQTPDEIFSYQPWQLVNSDANERRLVKLEAQRRHRGHYVISLADINDRDQASTLTGWRIEVPKASLPDLPDDEYYWVELAGMQVFDLTGTSLGTVDSLMETGANDVLIVQGERQRLIPFIRNQVVRKVDRTARAITVDWDADF